jgi:hypothetical protein
VADLRDLMILQACAAADPARRRQPPAAHCCANVATLLLARSVVRAREGDPRRARRVATHLALRYFAEARSSVAGAAASVGLSVILVRQILAVASAFIARRRYCHRLEGARLQRRGGGRHGRPRRPGAALAGDAHGAERGALRRRSRISRGACATPVEAFVVVEIALALP